MTENSISQWIAELKHGDPEAARQIWDRYFPRLCRFSRNKLGPTARRAQDEEDLALSAINALCAGAVDGRFQQLMNRDDLWQILIMIASRKAANVLRRPSIRRESGEGDFSPAGSQSWTLDLLADSPASPEFLDSVDIHCEELLSLLSEKLRAVAILKLRGYSNEEIANLRQRGLSTIERYLQMIREIWKESECSDAKKFEGNPGPPVS
jgi:DNA-directed RNA polymerase specialized sigma24 family protein